MADEEKKQYTGYGYHGGGRKAAEKKLLLFLYFFVFRIDTKQNRVYIINIRQERQPARSIIMRITMTKEIMVKKIEDLCKAEGITTVKEFRSFFEYWIIGWGEMDDDFSYEAKRIEKTLTAAQWKKGYSLVTDEDIESCLATKEEKEVADKVYAEKMSAIKAEEEKKSDFEKAAENEVECEMRDAGLEYDPSKTWEENIKENALNPEKKIDEVKKYSGYGYHGGGRKATGIKRVSICISGQPEQIGELKKMAAQEEKTVSAFILEKTGVMK